MPSSFRKLLETFNKPSQFYKLKQLLAPTLVSFTLWLAIGAFTASLLLDYEVTNVQWIFAVVLRMNISLATASIVHFITIIVLGGIFATAMIIVIIMSIGWTGVNLIRVVVFIVNKIKLNIKNLRNRRKGSINK